MKATISLLTAAMFASNVVSADELPDAVAKLNEIREREIERINSAYLQKLDGLLANYRAKGDQAAVAAVEKQIAAVEASRSEDEASPAKSPAEIDAILQPLIGKWRRDYDRNIFEFKDTKSGVYAGDTPFTMTYNPETKRVTLTAAKWVDSVSFTLHRDVLRGGHDNKIPYKLERIK